MATTLHKPSDEKPSGYTTTSPPQLIRPRSARCEPASDISRRQSVEAGGQTELCGGLDLNIHTSRQRQLVQSVDRFAGGLHNVDDALVRPDLELLPRLLVDVRAAENGVPFNPSRERDRSMNNRTGPLGRVNDVGSRLIEHSMIVGFHPNSN